MTIQEIFKSKGLTYLHSNRPSSPKIAKRIAAQNKENDLPPLRESINPNLSLYIAESEGMGLGLFTEHSIPINTFIGEYIGIVEIGLRRFSAMNLFHRDQIKTDYCWTYPMKYNLFTPLQINAEKAGNELRFVNHSFTPNLVDEAYYYNNEWHLFFKTTCEITPNSELLVDYGDAYWNHPNRQLYIPSDIFNKLQIKNL